MTSSNPASEGVTSYLVASSPEVLSQILRENECRGVEFNPGLYMTPANALNITKVEFAPAGHPPPSPSTRVRGPRSLPGSTQSTLSRGGSLEKGRGMRRKTSLAASMTSGGVQVTHEGQYLAWWWFLFFSFLFFRFPLLIDRYLNTINENFKMYDTYFPFSVLIICFFSIFYYWIFALDKKDKIEFYSRFEKDNTRNLNIFQLLCYFFKLWGTFLILEVVVGMMKCSGVMLENLKNFLLMHLSRWCISIMHEGMFSLVLLERR